MGFLYFIVSLLFPSFKNLPFSFLFLLEKKQLLSFPFQKKTQIPFSPEKMSIHHNNTTNSSSLPTTPKSGNGNTTTTKFHYNPYDNFKRVFQQHSTGSCSGSVTPRSNCSVSSRAHSRSVSMSTGAPEKSELQELHEHDHHHDQQQYSFKNVSSHENSSYEDDDDVAHQEEVSGTCTPAVRMETEQQFTPQEQEQEQEQEEKQNMMAMMVPKPRSSIKQQQQQQVDDDVTTTEMMEEQRKQGSGTLRATTRTMQHLLQNVPYLFLDTVAESTVLCREAHHRVGQHIMAWSNPKTPAELEQEFPERYQGQCIRDIFVAQLPFDLPLDAIQLVADLLIEGPRIHVLHAAPHIKLHKNYDGCSFVKMFECDAIRFINAMHKRVLFDVDGVWVATSLPELQELTDYCAWFQEQKHEQRKEILKMPTPFSAMTAEFALRGSRRATGNFYDNRCTTTQQQQQPVQPTGGAPFNNNNNGYYPPHHNQHQQQQQQQAPATNYNYYNAVYDQNPHQRYAGQYFSAQQQQQQHYAPRSNNNNNSNNNTNSYHNHQQQGTYQQGVSFYPNQAQIQFLAPHQKRALAGAHNNQQQQQQQC